MPSGNRALIRRIFQEVWNKGNLKAADEIVSLRYTMHDPMIDHESGIEAFTRHVTRVRAIFPISSSRLWISSRPTAKSQPVGALAVPTKLNSSVYRRRANELR